jgi:hypothetical protein
MACPRCECKVTYQYDDDDIFPSEGMERCAACGYIFDEDEALEEDDDA